MSITSFLPVSSLSETEQYLIAEIFAKPEVKKYLRLLATNDVAELISLSAISTDKDKLAQAHATVQGKLQVIATLLEIEAPTKEVQSN